MVIKSGDLFPKAYNQVFHSIVSHSHSEYTFTGGRASGKSSFISLAAIILLISNPDLNMVVVRKVANTLRRSVFEQIVWAINKLGLSDRFHIPKSQTSALPILYRRRDGSTQSILFIGADDPERVKSLKAASGYFGIMWAEEKTEFKPQELLNLKISVLRGGDKYWYFESFNPPSAHRHWCNIDARTAKPGRLIFHSTYLDVPAQWLGEAIEREIAHMKQTNERAYRNVFLGEATGSGLNVFENVTIREITDDEIAAFDWHYWGIDWGYYPDPFMWLAMSYSAKRKTLYIYDELRLLKASNFDASEKLKAKHPWQADRITADSAEPKSIADFREYGWNIRAAVKGKGSLEAGMKWLQGLDAIVVDPARAPCATDEFSLYEYGTDKKTGEVLAGYPQGQSDHCIAAARYAMESVWRKRGA